MTRRLHANNIHAKLGHINSDSMHVTSNHLQYSIKGMIEFSEECATAKSKHKFLHKVLEERDHKPDKLIYIDLRSQKKLIYGGSKNWIQTQDSDTKHKWSFFTREK